MKYRRTRIAAISALMITALPVAAAQPTAAKSEPFDHPAAVREVTLPPDPAAPEQKHELTCFYYAGFVVKQLDYGEKGAEQLSIAAASGGADQTPCQTGLLNGETILTDWRGYLRGAKGHYVFFDADDGWNGGMGFAVFDAGSGRKLFEDALISSFQAIEIAPPALKLRYERVYSAACSLFADDAAQCWRTVQSDTGVTGAAPDCRKAYQQEQERVPDYADETTDVPSVIDYNVTATIATGSSSLKPAGTVKRCRVSD